MFKQNATKLSKPLLPSDKVPLPMFLKMLNEAGMSMTHAMGVAAKVYKTHNTPTKLSALDVPELARLGVEDKERRREILAAFKQFATSNSGYDPVPEGSGSTSTAFGKGKATQKEQGKERKDAEKAAGTAQRQQAALDLFKESLTKRSQFSPSKKKKRTIDDLYEPSAPSAPSEPEGRFGTSQDATQFTNFDFNEVLEEEKLVSKTVVINRAPVMMAWSCIVAEKLGFEREEALSIASAYTEMNATTRGVNIGIYEKGKELGMEPGTNTAQPHVDLMGRRIPLFQMENGQWRALMKGEPVSPAKSYAYITRSLAQLSPYLIGALSLLAQSFEDPQRLNQRGYSLYCDFRPESGGGWGVRKEVKLATILRLREGQKQAGTSSVQTKNETLTPQKTEDEPDGTTSREPESKKRKIDEAQTLEEFEATEGNADGEEDFTLWDLYDE